MARNPRTPVTVSAAQAKTPSHRIWRTFLPFLPALATIFVSNYLFSKLGSNGILDAQTWPLQSGGGSTPDSTGIAEGLAIYRLFVFCTALLILLNNSFLYLPDISKASEEADPSNPGGRLARKAAFAMGIVVTAAIVVWLLDTWKSVIFPAQGMKNEIIGVVFFSLFAGIDLLLWHNCRQRERVEEDDSSRIRMKIEKEFYGSQVLFADLPVVVGLGVVWLIGHDLIHLTTNGGTFINGFRSGAVGMHLAYSQFVFVVLVLRNRSRLKKAGCL